MSRINNIFKGFKKLYNNGLSMQLRIFSLFLTSIIALMSAVIIILFATGTFKKSERELYQLSEKELNYIVSSFYDNTSIIANETTFFSNLISDRITDLIGNRSFAEVKNNDEILLEILERSTDPTLSSLRLTKASSCYIILDATINSNEINDSNQKASLFIINYNANASLSSISYLYARGPSSISMEHNLRVAPQWKMQYDVVADSDFYSIIENAKDSNINNSYKWYFTRSPYTEISESLRCAAPIILENGEVVGIVGFEISPSLFKSRYTSERYDITTSLLSKQSNNSINLEHHLSNNMNIPFNEELMISRESDYFSHYNSESHKFMGLSTTINLYSDNSIYKDDVWSFSLLCEAEYLKNVIRQENLIIISFFMAILLIFLALAILTSKWLVSPLKKAIETIKSENSDYESVNVPEIDDLLAFLSKKDLERKKHNPISDESKSTNELFKDFKRNVRTLTKAEKTVFNLYLEGYSAVEISEKIHLSMNTIKTHSRNIYMKLNISSRKELMLYVQMLEAEKDNK